MPDPRIHAFRDDLADEGLRAVVNAPRYVAGRPGRVIVGRAPVRRSPDLAAECLTVYHYGEEVLVFDLAGGYAWCQSQFDGYVGYVEEAGIAIGAPPRATHFVATLGSYTYREPDLRSAADDFLPRHSAAAVVETGIVTRGTEYVRLDTGAFLPLACLSAEPPCSTDIVSAAELYIGAAYLWGGRSILGIDCSGLVQSAFRDLGMTVPRDTDMQRDAIGERVRPNSEAELHHGDLLYMPGHVLIYAGGGAAIHADGATMQVRREDLAGFMRRHRLDLADFAIRRPAA